MFFKESHILWDWELRKGGETSHLILPRDLKSALSFLSKEEDTITQSFTCLMLSTCSVTSLPSSLQRLKCQRSAEKQWYLNFEKNCRNYMHEDILSPVYKKAQQQLILIWDLSGREYLDIKRQMRKTNGLDLLIFKVWSEMIECLDRETIVHCSFLRQCSEQSKIKRSWWSWPAFFFFFILLEQNYRFNCRLTLSITYPLPQNN